MAIPVHTTTLRQRRTHHDGATSESTKARLFLALACCWPLLITLFFSWSNTPTDTSVSSPHQAVSTSLGLKFRHVLDRVDIIGYGPTHPRVAVVIVGDTADALVLTLESVFANTDLSRIFLAVVVADGVAKDAELEKTLQKIDIGAIPHWHGLQKDLHESNEASNENPHSKKVHVLFNNERRGLAESRKDAIDFIRILEQSHVESGLKSEAEDLILLLLQPGAQLTSHQWLGPVTEALIVPPPLLGQKDRETVSLKLANAISFNLEGPNKRTSFDGTFTPLVTDATATEIAHSNGESYPSPALNGAALAMRLDTYINLPMQDLSLTEAWPANLDLALNLWLCADGIDMVRGADVIAMHQAPFAPLPPPMAARFAAAWMDDLTQKRFYNAYTNGGKSNGSGYPDLTYLDWETHMASAVAGPHFTRDLTQKCRSFAWYIENVNTDLSSILEQPVEVKRTPKQSDADKEPDVVPVKKVADADIVAAAADSLNLSKARNEKEVPKEEDGPDLSKARNAEELPKGNDVKVPESKSQSGKKKPKQPLCDECLQIIQKAQPIDIKFVDVSDGHKAHPHLGARDESGTPGYVHDETSLRKQAPPFKMEDDWLRSQCAIRDNTYKMLNEKVYVDLEYDKMMEKSLLPRDKIFCLVYTIDAFHSKIPPVRETWGQKCDGFMVASNQTDPTIGAVNILHEGPEEYNNIWQKVRSMWSYIYDNYYEKYDWFHIGGDDLFLIVENLRYYLESEEIKTAANGGIYLPDGTETEKVPLFLGRRFAYMGNMDDIFNSGGSGYTMNKAALKRLVVDGFPNYFPHAHTFSEDTMVARVFRQYGVFPYETKDELGGERYMPFMPGHHYGYRMPADHSKDWYAKYSINIKEGPDHCAARSVAFHYVKGDSMGRMQAMLYHLCPADTQ